MYFYTVFIIGAPNFQEHRYMHRGKILSEKIYKLKQREDITGNENCSVH